MHILTLDGITKIANQGSFFCIHSYIDQEILLFCINWNDETKCNSIISLWCDFGEKIWRKHVFFVYFYIDLKTSINVDNLSIFGILNQKSFYFVSLGITKMN